MIKSIKMWYKHMDTENTINVLKHTFMPITVTIITIVVFIGMFELKDITETNHKQVEYNAQHFALSEDVQNSRDIILSLDNRVKFLEKLHNLDHSELNAPPLIKPPVSP